LAQKGVGAVAAIEPGPEHAWAWTRDCVALDSAMGRYGLDKHTKVLVGASPCWHEARQLANADLAGGRVLERPAG
jgi:hypothetical protein